MVMLILLAHGNHVDFRLNLLEVATESRGTWQAEIDTNVTRATICTRARALEDCSLSLTTKQQHGPRKRSRPDQ